MANIIPFQALRYNQKKVSLKNAVCPPYDVINRIQRKSYIKQSPYNIVRLVLPDRKAATPDYKKARHDLLAWIDKDILTFDRSESFYIYAQESNVAKEKITRYGFLCLLELETAKNKGVLPHENVFLKPLMDRVNLMKNTRAHLSPIFIVFSDKKAKAQGIITSIIKIQRPDFDIYADNARHKLWRVSDKGTIKTLVRCLGMAQTFIADGHHRYKASIKARDYFEKKNIKTNGHRYTLAYMVSSQDKGLKILPTYRAVKVLPKDFSLDYIENNIKDFFSIKYISPGNAQPMLAQAFRKKERAFVLYYRKKYMYIALKDKKAIKDIGPKGSSMTWKGLDVSILHNLLFQKLLRIKEVIGKNRNIYYYKDHKELISQVDKGHQGLGVLLNPSTMDDVIILAKKDEKMPHKSTYFYPKPLTGLVVHKF
jgi:uncharacterized protein (DUF1015 family)